MLKSQAKQTELCGQCVTRLLWLLALRAHLAAISVLCLSANFDFLCHEGRTVPPLSHAPLLALIFFVYCSSSDMSVIFSPPSMPGTSTFATFSILLPSARTFFHLPLSTKALLSQRQKWLVHFRSVCYHCVRFCACLRQKKSVKPKAYQSCSLGDIQCLTCSIHC